MKFYYFLLIITATSVFGQESFLEHKTDKGESTYSVAKKYGITLDELIKFNPESKESVKLNQILKIPIYTKIAEIPKKTTDTNTSTKTDNTVVKTYTHTVISGETLYSLSKKFNIPKDSIESRNKEILKDGLRIGQELTFTNAPVANSSKSIESSTQNYEYDDKDAVIHIVKPKETLYSVARDYYVSVEDIVKKNSLVADLQIDQQIKIPSKKKTVDGRLRVINENTIFHVVQPYETKYSISRLYGITIGQLEIQNPEIIAVLKEGNKLAINIDTIKPKNANEELMLVLAEKQVVLEKSKVKTAEIESLKERLKSQEVINQKVNTINKLNFDLNLVDLKSTDVKSSEKLKLVLEANRKVQEVLKHKLDSLVYYMNNDLNSIKTMPVKNLDEVKKLEQASLENIAKTSEMSRNLKVELAENRKTYSDLMNKIERIVSKENFEYRKKVRESVVDKVKEPAPVISMEEVINYQNSHGENDIVNELLISKVEMLSEKKKEEVMKKITEASSSDKKQTVVKKSNGENDIVNEHLISKVDMLSEKKKEEVKKKLSESSSSDKKVTVVDDKASLTMLAKYKAEAIQKRKKNNVKEEVVTPISLPKVIEFLGKNPDFYKKEIAELKEIKNLKNVEDGYYIVADNFTDTELRDTLIKKLYDDGEFKAGYFLNTNTKLYVVYLDRLNSFEDFISTLKYKEKNPNYRKIKIIKLQYQESK